MDIHIPIIYYGDSREFVGFNLRLATDTSRFMIRDVRSHVYRKNADSVTLEYSLSHLAMTEFQRFNSTIHIRTLPDSDKGKYNIQLNNGDTLVTFTVAKKVLRDLEPDFVPLSWIWLDCDDNQLITPEIRSVSLSVIDYQYNHCIWELREPDIADTTQSLPTMNGLPAGCTARSSSTRRIVRELEFKNGGVHPYTPGVRIVGDVNANSISFEIDDALVIAQYITRGESAALQMFPNIGNMDMNCDKYPGDLSDFALLLRAATGDIMHEFYVADSITPDTITFSQDRSILSIDRPVIAALLIFDSEFPVELIADGSQSNTGTIDGNTHVLVYNLNKDYDTLLSVPSGKLLKTWGVLIDAYAVNYNGYKLQTVISH